MPLTMDKHSKMSIEKEIDTVVPIHDEISRTDQPDHRSERAVYEEGKVTMRTILGLAVRNMP